MQRMGKIMGIKPEKIEEYKHLHANVWPEVMAQIKNSNIRNYSIYLCETHHLLFSYWEYHGTDFEADMEEMVKDTKTQEWWQHTDPCQTPIIEGEKWSALEEIFHTE